MLGRIADRPVAPLPRSSASSTVSAWSSAVWPVNASGPRQIEASCPGPGLKICAVVELCAAAGRRSPQDDRRSAPQRGRLVVGLRGGSRGGHGPANNLKFCSNGKREQSAGVGVPPKKPQVTFVPGDGKAHRARSSPLRPELRWKSEVLMAALPLATRVLFGFNTEHVVAQQPQPLPAEPRPPGPRRSKCARHIRACDETTVARPRRH